MAERLSRGLPCRDRRRTLAAPAAAPRARVPLTILYATESGNAEGVGADLKKAAGKQGFAAKLLDMAEVSPAGIADQRNLLVVASTWGEAIRPSAPPSSRR